MNLHRGSFRLLLYIQAGGEVLLRLEQLGTGSGGIMSQRVSYSVKEGMRKEGRG
jgi:hypothetical protein